MDNVFGSVEVPHLDIPKSNDEEVDEHIHFASLGDIHPRMAEQPQDRFDASLDDYVDFGRAESDTEFLQGLDDLEDSLPLPVEFDLLPSFVQGGGQEEESSRVTTRASGIDQQNPLPITCASIRYSSVYVKVECVCRSSRFNN